MSKIRKVSEQSTLSIFDFLDSPPKPLNEISYDQINRDQSDFYKSEFKKDALTDRQKEIKDTNNKRKEDLSQIQRQAKLEHNSFDEIDLMRSGRSIRSARYDTKDGITDTGGSSLFGMQSRMPQQESKELTNREITELRKEASAQIRKKKEEEYRQSHLPMIGEDESYSREDSRKIASNSVVESSQHLKQSGTISMFDNVDFERIQDKTMEVRSPKSKDDSWKKVQKTSSYQDREKNMIDSFLNQSNSDQNQTDNFREDTTSRLYNAMFRVKPKANKD